MYETAFSSDDDEEHSLSLSPSLSLPPLPLSHTRSFSLPLSLTRSPPLPPCRVQETAFSSDDDEEHYRDQVGEAPEAGTFMRRNTSVRRAPKYHENGMVVNERKEAKAKKDTSAESHVKMQAELVRRKGLKVKKEKQKVKKRKMSKKK